MLVGAQAPSSLPCFCPRHGRRAARPSRGGGVRRRRGPADGATPLARGQGGARMRGRARGRAQGRAQVRSAAHAGMGGGAAFSSAVGQAGGGAEQARDQGARRPRGARRQPASQRRAAPRRARGGGLAATVAQRCPSEGGASKGGEKGRGA